MRLHLLPVYSRLADPIAVEAMPELKDCLPDGLRLSEHQLATYQALRDDNIDVVINTAMTGDGKSLAGLLPLLTDPRHNGTLALFPTNELIQDQFRSAGLTLPAWRRPAAWAGMLYGARLDTLMAEFETLKRPDALIKVLKDHRLTLSNPDIFHAIMQFSYQQPGRSLDHVTGQLPLLFEQLTFDEFHIFETPQVIAVLTALLFLRSQQRALKTLFLSATPAAEVLRLLDRAGFSGRIRLIDPQREGWYHHGVEAGAEWRPILRASTLHFAPQQAEPWIASDGERILLEWFRQHRPAAKGALIVNSVATALRLTQRLRPLFEREGLSVECNTGITGYRMRQASYQADLLIGTSTVDVGVDFRINLLVFEALNSGTFLQRLGRLGRHAGFVDRGGTERQFEAFAAYALVPPFIYDRLSLSDAGSGASLHDGETCTRADLAQAIQAVFPPAASFSAYARRWGRFVPAYVIQTLCREPLKTTYARLIPDLLRHYGRLTQSRIGEAMREARERTQHGEKLLIQEARAFRGGSPFDCGVIKEQEREVVTYDLFWLLANGHLELLTQDEFCEMVRRLGKPDTPYRRGWQCAFFRWRNLRVQQERVEILLPPAVAAWGAERQQVAVVLPQGTRVDCNGHDFLNRLNREISRRQYVALLVPGKDPRQVQREAYLPPGMHLWPYRLDGEGGELRGTVAFGREALLLDSRLHHRPLEGADAPFIC
ncbi:MAG: type I-D CRISPR-associated helicase Cas3' [Chloroflexaceae bacterium]